MSKCLNCGKPIEQSKGKRQKTFCDSTCRSNNWQKEQRKNKKETVLPTILAKPTKVTVKKENANWIKNAEEALPPKIQGESTIDYKIRIAESELPKSK